MAVIVNILSTLRVALHCTGHGTVETNKYLSNAASPALTQKRVQKGWHKYHSHVYDTRTCILANTTMTGR